jgi:hypothetical protein
MLKLTIPAVDYFDDAQQLFITQAAAVLELEHSLVSLSKWESIHEKAFLGPEEKTREETLGYIYCMTLTPDVPPEVYQNLSNDNIKQIQNYIGANMTATTITNLAETKSAPKRREIITAEIIYYWMVSHNIPFECQHWHLNRLITLIQVCNEKNKPEDKKKKMSQRELAARNRELNAQRKAKLNTTG